MLRVPVTQAEEQELLAGATVADLGIGEYLRETGLGRARRESSGAPEPIRSLHASVRQLEDLIADLDAGIEQAAKALALSLDEVP